MKLRSQHAKQTNPTHPRPAPRMRQRGRRTITDDERLGIATAALYLAPRYCNRKTEEWKLVCPAKFEEVKRLLESERSVSALMRIFREWFREEANKRVWEQMREDALSDWDGYFTAWINFEKEIRPGNQRDLPPDSRARDGRPEPMDGGEGYEREEQVQYDVEFDTGDAEGVDLDDGDRGNGGHGQLPKPVLYQALHVQFGRVYVFHAPVTINLQASSAEKLAAPDQN